MSNSIPPPVSLVPWRELRHVWAPEVPLDLDQGLVSEIARWNARDRNRDYLIPEDYALALAQHPVWKGAFLDLGLPHSELRGIFREIGGNGADLSQARAQMGQIRQRARELCSGDPTASARGEGPFCGICLLQAIVETSCPTGSAILRLASAPVAGVLKKWRQLCPNVRVARSCRFRTKLGRLLRSVYFSLLTLSLPLLLLASVLYHSLSRGAFATTFAVTVLTAGAVVLFSWIICAPVAAVLRGACAARSVHKQRRTGSSSSTN